VTDFIRHSLVLEKDGTILWSSDKSGIRPLMECVGRFKGNERDCTLYDRVVGLAAARLIVYSGMISLVYTPVGSEQARAHLGQAGIPFEAGTVVPKILNKDRTTMCPMETRAQGKDDSGFYAELKNLFMQ
jgi:hypothetical protein